MTFPVNHHRDLSAGSIRFFFISKCDRIVPYFLIHAAFLSGVCYHSFSSFVKPQPVGNASGLFFLLCSIFSELVVAVMVYLIVQLFPKKIVYWLSTLVLMCILVVSALYYIITVKTQTIYGTDFLLNEASHFLFYYGPSYLNLSTGMLLLMGFIIIWTAPYLLSLLLNWNSWARYSALGIVGLNLSFGMIGWIVKPPREMAEFINRGPLQTLVSATIKEAYYADKSSSNIKQVDKLLDAVQQNSDETNSAISLKRFKPANKIIVYLMEGVSDVLFQPESKFINLFPALSRWHKHTIRFTNYYTLSTLTGHAYQVLNIGGYIRSGSRLEILNLKTLSQVNRIKRAGYDTAFFSSFDTDYKATRVFFNDSGFRTVVDLDDFGDRYRRKGRVVEDRALIDTFKQWSLGRDKFYIIINPQDTHHPYWNPDGIVLKKSYFNPAFSQYLNAMVYQDKILGDLIDYIDVEMPDALLIVTSDHGFREYFPELQDLMEPYEGFSASFEMRFHVPFYIYNKKKISRPEHTPIPMSHVDLIFTIMDLMGLPPSLRPLTGSSISEPKPRIHFLNTRHNLDTIGLLDGRYKFFFETQTGENRLYMLRYDDGEWKRADSDHNLPLVQHYTHLALAWYEYLTR